jgi:uncharacterized membrane protein
MSRHWLGLLLLGVWIGGSEVAHATLAINPESLSFGTVTVGQSPTMSGTLTASPSVAITLSLGSSGCGEFKITSPTSPTVGTGGSAKTLTVKFTPTSTGPKDCTISAKDSNGVEILAVDVTATANAATLSLTPATPLPPFSDTEVGRTSTAQTLTATNTGDAPLVISSATLSSGASDFTVTGVTATTLNPGENTTWNIACAPSTLGPRNGNFRITSNSSTGATTDVALSCTGEQGIVTTSATTHDFGGVQVGSTVSFNFTLQNTGNVPITQLTGALSDTTKGYVFDPATVPTSLAAGASKMLTVLFHPLSGADGGIVNLTFNAVWGTNNTPTTATLALNGDGQGASFTVSPPTVNFGSFRFDTQPQLVYHIKNAGDLNVAIAPQTIVLDTGTASTELTFTIKKGSSTVTLPQTLMPAEQLDVTVQAKPQNRTGAIGAHVTVHSTTTGTTDQQVTITGTATAAAVMATATVDFATTPSPTKTITIKNTGDAVLDLPSITPTNANAAFTFTNLPSGASQLQPNSTLTITVTYKPTTVRGPGDFDTAVLVANLSGVLNGPAQAMTQIQGRGIDRSLVIDGVPIFPATFRNPGDKAPTKLVTVHNNGEATLRISAVMVSGSPVWQVVDANPIDILGGSTHDFQVKFSPTMVGAAPTGQLILVNDDKTKPTAMVTLNGTCMDRQLLVNMAPINLGFIPVGSSITAADILAVQNMDPSTSFTIHMIQLGTQQGDTIQVDDTSAFRIDNAPADIPLPAMGMQSFAVTFAPTTIDHFTTTAFVYIDEDPTPQAAVQITGDAVFIEAHGGGGCDAGGTGRGGELTIGLAILGALRRRRKRRSGFVITAVATAAILMPVTPARADDIGIAVFEPTPSTTGAGFALQAPDVGASGSWVANAVISYASNPLVLNSFTSTGGQITTAPVEKSTLIQLGVAHALLDRFELGAHIPLYQQSGESGLAGPPAKGTALGNLALHAKVRLLGGRTEPRTFIVGASATITVPTASKGQFTGSDQPEARLLLLGSFTPSVLTSRLTLSVNAGPVIRGKSEYANIVEKSGVAWGVGASYRILNKLWATTEVFGQSIPSGQSPHPTNDMMPSPLTLSPVEWLAGLSIHPERRIVIGLAIGGGVTDAIGAPDLRGVLSLAFVPGAAAIAPIHPPHPPEVTKLAIDSDGDGIPDSLDKCLNEPEDKDGFQDEDGCPDLDNDQDGIPDVLDKCPLEPEDKDGFQDEDGCPDPDNDGDGIADAKDKCPNEPETFNGKDDDDGCPDAVETPSIAVTTQGSATKAAEDTFTRGRELLKQAKYQEACTAFEQSQRLDPQFGTQYNIAGCYEKIGKLATAWNLYRELARSDTNPTRRSKSGGLATALASRVPKIKLVLPKKLEGVQISMNGENANAMIGIEAPVDFGSYELVVSATGYRAWRKTVDIHEEGKAVTVVIDPEPVH